MISSERGGKREERRASSLVAVYDLNQQVVLTARAEREQSNANVKGKCIFIR